MFPPDRKRALDTEDFDFGSQDLDSPVSSFRTPLQKKRSRYILFPESEFEQPQRLFRENPFNSVPDEILIRIFRFLRKPDLHSCMATCSRFYKVASDADLWHSIDLNRQKVNEKGLLLQVQRGTKMLRASFASSRVRIHQVRHSLELNLQYIDLTNAIVSQKLIETLLKGCERLKMLSLENQTLNDKICRAISSKKDLETLNLCMASGITHTGIASIMQKCVSLKVLNVAWTTMDSQSVLSLTTKLPKTLIELNIAGYTTFLKDCLVFTICQRCPQLEKLCVSDNRNLSPDLLHPISTMLLKLRHLDVSRCHHLFWPEFMAPLATLPEFKYLSCYGYPDNRYVEEIKAMLPHVEVNNYQCSNLSAIARPQHPHSVNDSLWDVPLQLS